MMINSFKYRLNPKRKDLFKTINFLYLNKHIKNNSILFLLYTTHEKNKDLLMKMIEKNVNRKSTPFVNKPMACSPLCDSVDFLGP
jgi:hypothetical protein